MLMFISWSVTGKAGLGVNVSGMTGGGSLTLVTRGVSTPTVTLVTRPPTIVTPTHPTNTTRPLVRLVPGNEILQLTF